MSKSNDQIFQLSLTELAFILTFILLLLAAVSFIKKDEEINKCHDTVARCENFITDEEKKLLDAANVSVEQKQFINLGEIIPTLTELKNAKEQLESYKKQTADLEKEISTLAPIKTILDKFQNGIQEQAKQCVKDAINPPPLSDKVRADKCIKELKGYKKRFAFPSCWLDKNGKIEFLFSVNLTNNGIVVSPAWAKERDNEAQLLPNIHQLINKGEPISIETFKVNSQEIFQYSENNKPEECRFYVRLSSTISDAVKSDRARLAVESVFYKDEKRR
jgi:hypothetical protein